MIFTGLIAFGWAAILGYSGALFGALIVLPGVSHFAMLQAPEEYTAAIRAEEGRLIMSIHALVIETPDRRIVVDTCIGNDKQRANPNWTNLQKPFLADMAAAGYPVESIDTVMCTHLHVDHVGWNTMLVDGKWVPTFANARYLMATPEFDYWRDQDTDEESRVIFDDSVQPVFDAGRPLNGAAFPWFWTSTGAEGFTPKRRENSICASGPRGSVRGSVGSGLTSSFPQASSIRMRSPAT